MKNRILEINNRVNEAKVSKKCYELFGDYLFGEFVKWHKEYKEKDTPPEMMAFEDLEDFLYGMNTEKTKSKALIKHLRNLKACEKSYPEILSPTSTNLYRGTALHIEVIKSSLGSLSQGFIDDVKAKTFSKYRSQTEYILNLTNADQFVLVSKNFKYSPKSFVQSWSPSVTTAETFGKGKMGHEYYFNREVFACVLNKSFSKKELLFNPKFLNSMTRLSDENEIIRFGKDVSGCSLWMPRITLMKALKISA